MAVSQKLANRRRTFTFSATKAEAMELLSLLDDWSEIVRKDAKLLHPKSSQGCKDMLNSADFYNSIAKEIREQIGRRKVSRT